MMELLKIADNSVDYSLGNTTKQALWLNTTREAKYKAKQAVDSFFMRGGDVVPAGLGLHGRALGARRTGVRRHQRRAHRRGADGRHLPEPVVGPQAERGGGSRQGRVEEALRGASPVGPVAKGLRRRLTKLGAVGAREPS